jgi:NAD(P)-dependent dehydrogenase (short-subunit alcohol dehydrogenase family)
MSTTTKNNEKHVLVTGCSGRIGSAVCHELSKTYYVHGFDRLECSMNLKNTLTSFICGDLLNEDLLRKALRGCQYVVHLAACPDDADFETVLLPCNILGTVTLLKEIEKINLKQKDAQCDTSITRLVIASSGKLFAGHNGEYPIKHNDLISPICSYGATKAFVEGAAASFSQSTSTGCTTVCLRFAWCPRTAEDMKAYRNVPFNQPDEFLSPYDAATCVRASLMVNMKNQIESSSSSSSSSPSSSAESSTSSSSFMKLFVQSIPTKGRLPRFDLTYTTLKLNGWYPERSFPDNMDDLVRERSMNTIDSQLRPRNDPSPGIFLSTTNAVAANNNNSVRSRVSQTEWDLRVMVAAAYQIFAMNGWTHSIHTHITAKVPPSNNDEGEEEAFLINPYGYHWDEITASSLIKVNAKGHIIDHGSTNLPINPAGNVYCFSSKYTVF